MSKNDYVLKAASHHAELKLNRSFSYSLANHNPYIHLAPFCCGMTDETESAKPQLSHGEIFYSMIWTRCLKMSPEIIIFVLIYLLRCMLKSVNVFPNEIGTSYGQCRHGHCYSIGESACNILRLHSHSVNFHSITSAFLHNREIKLCKCFFLMEQAQHRWGRLDAVWTLMEYWVTSQVIK